MLVENVANVAADPDPDPDARSWDFPGYSVTMIEERWLPAPGYPNYSVSDLGNVRSEPRMTRLGKQVGGVVLKVMRSTAGYGQVNLSGWGIKPRTVQIHNLVMEAFVGPCPKGMVVRFRSKDRADARLDNLFYGDRSWLRHASLSEDSVRQIRTAVGDSLQKDLAEEYGVSRSTISAIVRRKTWRQEL